MCVSGIRASWENNMSMNVSCTDDQNLKIVRCHLFQGRPYHDFWSTPKTAIFFCFFKRDILCISNLRFYRE